METQTHPTFDLKSFDLSALLREAEATKKTAYELLKLAGIPSFKFGSDQRMKAYSLEELNEGLVRVLYESEPFESKSASADDGIKRVTLTASTDATDLVGDVMTEWSLKRMAKAAPGTVMFLNHKYTVPEDVFGTIEKARVVKKKITHQGETYEVMALEYVVAVATEEENPRAVKVYNMIAQGKRKLGASVTVAVTEETEMKDGRRAINDVYYLETSVVGIPCNQLSWAHKAQKALAPAATEIKQMENAMTDTQKQTADIRQKAMEVIEKGLFTAEMESRKPTNYQLYDIYTSALYKLWYVIYGSENGGVEVDVLALLDEIIAEYGAALRITAADYLGLKLPSEGGQTKQTSFTIERAQSLWTDLVSKAHQTDEGRALLQKMQTAIGITKGEAAQEGGILETAGAESKTITNLNVEVDGEQKSYDAAGIVALIAEIKSLKSEAETTQKDLETARKDLKIAEATARTATALAERLADQPLAGV